MNESEDFLELYGRGNRQITNLGEFARCGLETIERIRRRRDAAAAEAAQRCGEPERAAPETHGRAEDSQGPGQPVDRDSTAGG